MTSSLSWYMPRARATAPRDQGVRCRFTQLSIRRRAAALASSRASFGGPSLPSPVPPCSPPRSRCPSAFRTGSQGGARPSASGPHPRLVIWPSGRRVWGKNRSRRRPLVNPARTPARKCWGLDGSGAEFFLARRAPPRWRPRHFLDGVNYVNYLTHGTSLRAPPVGM